MATTKGTEVPDPKAVAYEGRQDSAADLDFIARA